MADGHLQLRLKINPRTPTFAAVQLAAGWFRLGRGLFQGIAALLILSACASFPERGASTRAPASVEDRAVVNGEVLPLPEESEIQIDSLPAEPAMSPVVQSLLASAEQQRNTGDPDAAANSLERALRIEPGNATLWSRLADVRYAQQDWQQAVQLAAKSNILAGSNHQLRRQNWYLMANAYSALGDHESARRYRDKLNQ